MHFRVSADHAGSSIREAAWDLEERVLWRGSDAVRGALEPLQRFLQTKLTWPLGDAYRRRGRITRGALAASAIAVAIGAGVAGARIATDHPAAQPALPLPPASVTAAPRSNPDSVVLQGVTPQFQPGHAAPPPPSAPPAKPSTPAAQVALQFAQAFVGYEVGRSNHKTQAVFEATATKPLAKSLAADPPRLPANGKVPQARVLNVVLGSGTKTQVTASVSLIRLRAMSEVRLTLTKSGANWRVAQVLG